MIMHILSVFVCILSHSPAITVATYFHTSGSSTFKAVTSDGDRHNFIHCLMDKGVSVIKVWEE
jgi:hypothetical protein